LLTTIINDWAARITLARVGDKSRRTCTEHYVFLDNIHTNKGLIGTLAFALIRDLHFGCL
jgi:hypothetical protein